MTFKTLSVVIPTYNEKENIRILIPRIFEVLDKIGIEFELIVVDDTSPDGTAEEVRKLGEYFNCKVIVKEKKEGIGAAHVVGYNESKGEIILTMDADLSHNPGEIPKLLTEIKKGADVVLGSRHLSKGFYEGEKLQTKIKKYISNFGNTLVRLLLGTEAHDYSNGFRCFKKEVWGSIQTVEKGNAFLMEFVVRAHRGGYKIVEVPTTFVDRRMGESKLNLPKESMMFLLQIIRLYIQHSKIKYILKLE